MNPITRKEMFLAAAGGQDVTTPTPVTREEVFLDAIAKGGSGGGSSGGGVLVVNMTLNDAGTIGTLDKTWQEIHDADFPVVRFSYQGRVFWYQVLDAGQSDGGYGVTVVMNFKTVATEEFKASTTDGYPSKSF